MNLSLSEHETELLRGLFEGHLPELRRQVARTEKHDLRHPLVERLELVERLLARLTQRAA